MKIYKHNNIKRLLRAVFMLFVVIFFVFITNSCLVTNKGKTTKSETIAYLKYTNKPLKYSSLVPEEWIGKMTIGGEYRLIPNKKNLASIAFGSSNFQQFTALKNKQSINLEEYKAYHLSLFTEDQMGPELKYTITETTLSGIKAYIIEYTYLPVGRNKKMYFKEIFTVNKGRIFTLYYYANIDNYKEYQKEFEICEKSYKILK